LQIYKNLEFMKEYFFNFLHLLHMLVHSLIVFQWLVLPVFII